MNKEELLKKNYEIWTSKPFDNETIEKVKKLKNNNPLEFEESFYKNLSFGTGGMRGIVGIGPNRVNNYTFGKNTQGIANYINKISTKQESVVIAYDCRNQSQELANQVAEIFSSNNIKVYLFDSIRPTAISLCRWTVVKLSSTGGCLRHRQLPCIMQATYQ